MISRLNKKFLSTNTVFSFFLIQKNSKTHIFLYFLKFPSVSIISPNAPFVHRERRGWINHVITQKNKVCDCSFLSGPEKSIWENNKNLRNIWKKYGNREITPMLVFKYSFKRTGFYTKIHQNYHEWVVNQRVTNVEDNLTLRSLYTPFIQAKSWSKQVTSVLIFSIF